MDRIPASERTREKLKALMQGRSEMAARTEEFHPQTAGQAREGGGAPMVWFACVGSVLADRGKGRLL